MDAPERSPLMAHWVQSAKAFRLPLFVSARRRWLPASDPPNCELLAVELQAPTREERAQLWPRLASGLGCRPEPQIDWDNVSSVFRLTPGKMLTALRAAGSRVKLASSAGAPLTAAVLHSACSDASNQALAALASKLTSTRAWDDLVLPHSTLLHLKEICGHLRHRRLVYGTWGFSARHASGQGLCVLFHGSSGTGKTLALEVIANELLMDAYRIDLSTVVSKYIGETEKNLSRIFEEAESSNALLFFDEADALFGKRSEVKDAHDRYANIEINYLLQRIESYEGPVFLATNARNHIDEAFFRRMQFAVEFPMPDTSLRYRLWKCHLPASAPLAADVDLEFLARRFSLTGGNIKNVVINAAFLAAGDSSSLHMHHFISALCREYEKIGLLLTENDVRPYHLGSSSPAERSHAAATP